MKITLSNLSASPFSPLMPTPNVAEWEAIKACLAADTTPPVTDLLAEPLTFLATHRGSVLYCAGGVTVYRMAHHNDFWLEDWPQASRFGRAWAKLKQQWNFAVAAEFGRVLDDFRPDIVNTHSLLDVSTLVSGEVIEDYKDFNDKVNAGDVLLQIDPAPTSSSSRPPRQTTTPTSPPRRRR